MLQEYVGSVTEDIGDYIQAILLVGSLATGSYVPGPGDIDQITILKDEAGDETVARAHKHIEATMAAYNRAVNLASMVYRRFDLERPWPTCWDYKFETRHLVTVPQELMMIHDHGQVLHGEPNSEISQLPKPTRGEMVAYDERRRRWHRELASVYPEMQRSREEALQRPRIAVNVVLSNAIWHYYYATGRICFNKHEIASRLRREVPSYRFQEGVELATHIRTSGYRDISDAALGALREWCDRFRHWSDAQPPGSVPL
jgi:hypothetical protein